MEVRFIGHKINLIYLQKYMQNRNSLLSFYHSQISGPSAHFEGIGELSECVCGSGG